MKNFKKIASAIAALSLAACVAVPMSATVFTASAENTKITIQKAESDTGTHAYEGYKIFSGTMQTVAGGTEEKVLVGLDWAFKTGVVETDKTDFFNALKGKWDDLSATPTASEVAAKLGNTNFNADVEAFAGIVGQYADKLFTKIEGDATGITVSEAGYYMVQDSKNPETGETNSGAKTRYILKVVDADGKAVTVQEKAAAPSVDKQVYDHNGTKTGDALDSGDTTKTGWGETADHEIGETFQFKLIAQLPTSAEFDEYDTYTLQFNDKWDDGIDYVGNGKLVVTVPGEPAQTYTFAETAVPEDSIESWGENVDVKTEGITDGYKLKVQIKDLKALLARKATSLSGVKVEFIYDAKLNANANAANANATDNAEGKYEDGTAVNDNSVDLWYSHNPNSTGSGDFDTDHGETPEDTVGVFTYQVNNKKVDQDNKALPGAGFKLYKEVGSDKYYANFTGGTEDGTYTFSGWATEANTGGTQMESLAGTGVFNFKGLDAGTYKLEETKTPEGYNSLGKDVEIKIVAEHSEATNVGANLTLTKAEVGGSSYDGVDTELQKLEGTIQNQKGATLPSTGGIGTTLFYLGGGALVAVAGVMLITKKRMTKE